MDGLAKRSGPVNAGKNKTLRIYTIGHSTLAIEPFVSLLKEYEIGLLADVRRYPSSRRFPHFNRPTLCNRLNVENIDYLWLEVLGGRRQVPQDGRSPNTGLRSPGFRSYADYMATEAFRNGVQELLSTAARSRTAIMCAEKLYWKCHRRILSDYLVSQGVEVIHILDPGKIATHTLTPDAVITESGIIYPPAQLRREEKSLFDLGE